jgi:hypothetical protein
VSWADGNDPPCRGSSPQIQAHGLELGIAHGQELSLYGQRTRLPSRTARNPDRT